MSVSRRIKNLWSRLAEPGTLHMLYQALTLAPRLVLHVASVAAIAGFFGACVPATRYEEAKSASEVELAGRQRAEAELAATRAKLDAALAELNQREAKLAESEQSVSASKLENSVALKERDEATSMVEQLRSDLARVGDNLRSYAQQKAELEKSLQAAQAHQSELEQGDARVESTARLTRDLTSALGDRVTNGDIAVDVREGRVVATAPMEDWLSDDASARKNLEAVVAAVSRVLALHPQSSLELGLPLNEGDPRMSALLTALVARNVPAARLKLVPAGAQAKAVQLAFSPG